jgi:cell division protein FtsL
MKKYTKLNIILIVAIFIVAVTAFAIWHQGEQTKIVHGRAEMYLQAAKIESEQKDKQNKNLEVCLAEAESEFQRVFQLNSVEGTTPGGVKARKWNSTDIADKTEENYRKDKEFCLKLYK